MDESAAAFGAISALGKNDVYPRIASDEQVVLTFDHFNTLTFTLKGSIVVLLGDLFLDFNGTKERASESSSECTFNDSIIPLF